MSQALSLMLGAATGIRSTAGFAILASSSAAPESSALADPRASRAIQAALVAEALADKIGALPPRTDFVPLAGRAFMGAAAAALGARWSGGSPAAAGVVGACAAVGAAWAATSLRSAAAASGSVGPALQGLAAAAEDLMVLELGGEAARLLRSASRWW